MAGPLDGVRVLEVAGLGALPFAAMLLADMGAEVLRIDRVPGSSGLSVIAPERDVLHRGRRCIALDLKHPEGASTVLDLVGSADALIEGFRPGVMERLGVGPHECRERNPRLVYGRLTGWGQAGPLAQRAGHDINFIAVAGALAHFRRVDSAPVPPLNLVGDMAGGGMLLAYGIVCALYEARTSGTGQVVDAAMLDGTALLMSLWWGLSADGGFDAEAPGTNVFDTGSPFYEVYQCADGKELSVGASEPKFYELLLDKLGLRDEFAVGSQYDNARWPQLRQRLTEVFASRTRAAWELQFADTDCCVAPVLTMAEALRHPHNVDREVFVELGGIAQPAPAPRLSRTPGVLDRMPAATGEHTRQALADWGITPRRVDELVKRGIACER